MSESRRRRIGAVLSSAFIAASGLSGAFVTGGCSQDNGCAKDSPEGDCDTSAGGAGGGSQLGYCDVQPIIYQYCVRCHSNPPQNFAAFSLASWDDLQAPFSSTSEDLVWERMAAPIERGFMPLTSLDLDPPVESLPAPAKDILLEWLKTGAPFGEHCEP